MKNDASAFVHLGVGGCLISVKRLRYIPRIKGTKYTEAYIVCAIAIALSILWEMQFQKKKIPELTEYELEEERRVRELDYLIYMINAHAEK